jgi:hypothetical protein
MTEDPGRIIKLELPVNWVTLVWLEGAKATMFPSYFEGWVAYFGVDATWYTCFMFKHKLSPEIAALM